MLRQRRVVFWGHRTYPTVTIPRVFLTSDPPPAYTGPLEWTTVDDAGETWVHSMESILTDEPEGRAIYSEPSYEGGSWGVVFGTSRCKGEDSDDDQAFQFPERIEPYRLALSWKSKELENVVPELRQRLHEAAFWSKTVYFNLTPEGLKVTFAVKTDYRNRVYKAASALRAACRWARRQGTPLRVNIL